MSATPQTVALDAQAVLNFVNNVLPIINAFTNAGNSTKNQQQIQLGLSAAQSLVTLISSIPTNTGIITTEQQAAHLSKAYAILSNDPNLYGPEWNKQN